ncbi:MAG: VIT1/CCC1 transporter family protein [Firmicutes bacterium]|nr:VIT1/CCC1 transporter family protein [Alicyclobacillaceae bacterium]MCL6496172.1 VIT1/CCC1 transporter family protein [Bacillota bacterium]
MQPDRVHTPAARAIREVVFGVNDGLVSITGLVVGVASSHMTGPEVLKAGIAAAVAATVAMGLGAYLSTAAQNEYFLAERAREAREVREMPDDERAEVEGIYRAQGFPRDLTRVLTDHVTADPERWIDFMMKEELGIHLDRLDNPWQSAGVMALAVLLGSLPPLAPFLLLPRVADALPWTLGLGMGTAFVLGVVKARVAKGNWWKSGIQFVLVSAAAACAGIIAGHWLGGGA